MTECYICLTPIDAGAFCEDCEPKHPRCGECLRPECEGCGA